MKAKVREKAKVRKAKVKEKAKVREKAKEKGRAKAKEKVKARPPALRNLTARLVLEKDWEETARWLILWNHSKPTPTKNSPD